MKVLVIALALVLPEAKTTEAEAPDLNKFIFFAVLQGCMEDGVPDKLVRRILEKKDNNCINFVYSCPLCHPAIEGFQAYLMRRDFYYGRKGDPYIPRKCLLPDDFKNPKEIQPALEKMIARWIKSHMKRMRLSKEEIKTLNTRMLIGRKKAMESIKKLGSGMKKCPTCEGSVAGSEFRKIR